MWEWCATKWQDRYEDYRDDNDPEGDVPRVVRGGSFYADEGFARCAIRYRDNPFNRLRIYGFRLVVVALVEL